MTAPRQFASRQGNMRLHQRQGLVYFTFPHLEAAGGSRLLHAFSSRIGGVSEGCYASLNFSFSTGDTEEHVLANLQRFGQVLGFDPARRILTHQTHSCCIRWIREEDAGRGIADAQYFQGVDGLISAAVGVPLFTQHADCTPLFFYAPQAQMIGLAHAGWRGSAGQIGPAMVAYFARLGVPAAQLLVGIGPCAGPCCYEVGAEVAGAFSSWQDAQGPVALPRPDGKFLLDLPRANRAMLVASGVPAEQIVLSDLCTICHEEFFYSHRRDGRRRGGMLALMMLR